MNRECLFIEPRLLIFKADILTIILIRIRFKDFVDLEHYFDREIRCAGNFFISKTVLVKPKSPPYWLALSYEVREALGLVPLRR